MFDMSLTGRVGRYYPPREIPHGYTTMLNLAKTGNTEKYQEIPSIGCFKAQFTLKYHLSYLKSQEKHNKHQITSPLRGYVIFKMRIDG